VRLVHVAVEERPWLGFYSATGMSKLASLAKLRYSAVASLIRPAVGTKQSESPKSLIFRRSPKKGVSRLIKEF
jgi:hypothetical protein